MQGILVEHFMQYFFFWIKKKYKNSIAKTNRISITIVPNVLLYGVLIEKDMWEVGLEIMSADY